MSLEKVADASQATRIHNAIFNMARYGEATSRIRLVARMPLTFQAIMHEVYVCQKETPSITDQDVLEFQRALQRMRRESVGVPHMMRDIVDGINTSQLRYAKKTSVGVTPRIDVPTDSNGMCYPKPNGGKRILPSIYTRIKKWWMRANGVTVEVVDMNDGHLENTMKLLQESHGNVIAKSTELLGKMANHFHNQSAVVQQLEDLCMAMQKVDVDAMYPIFKELATEAAQRKATPAMLVAVNPAWFEDGELDWSDK